MDNGWRAHKFESLVKRFIHVGKTLKTELKLDCSVVFLKLYVSLFQKMPSSCLDLFLGEQSITVGDTLDLLFLIGVNTFVFDRQVYLCMYWATQLLHVLDEGGGRRLQHALEVQGFVFSDNPDQAASQMRISCRKPPIWDRVRHSVEQICVSLNMPQNQAVAGLYNNIIDKCCLPERQVPTASKNDLRRLIDHYFNNALYRNDICKYVDTYMGGNRIHNVTVNGDTSSVAIWLEEKKGGYGCKRGGGGGGASNSGKPFFSCREACVEALKLTMQNLLHKGYPDHRVPWFISRYSLQKNEDEAASSPQTVEGEKKEVTVS